MKPSEPGTHSLNECQASLADNSSTIQHLVHIFIQKGITEITPVNLLFHRGVVILRRILGLSAQHDFEG